MSRASDLEYPRRVVVDDTDPRITYDSGSWNFDASTFDNFGIFGDPYNRTMRGTNSGEAKFSFTFEGEFIQVKGAKDNRKISRPENSTSDDMTRLPKYTCQVDGSNIQTVEYRPFMYDITNNVLCEQSRLSKGKHTLNMTITLGDTNTQTFWLDSLEYAPLENADLSKEVLKVDGSDPSITYHNDTGSWNTDSKLFNGTGVTGASMSFKFNGTSVTLYGFNEGSDKDWDRTSGRYYIDNAGDTTFDIPGSKPLPFNQQNRTDWYNQQVFTSEKVAAGEHEMVITYTGVKTGSNPAAWLLVDYLYVTGGAKDGSLAGGSDGSNSGSSGVGQEKSKTPVGAIAGGVVGGVVVLLAAAGLLFWLWRRKQARGGPRELYPKEGLDPTPFMAGDMVATGHGDTPASSKGALMYPVTNPSSAAPGPSEYPESVYTTGPSGATLLTLSHGGGPSVHGGSSVSAGDASEPGTTSASQNLSDIKSAQSQAVSVQTRQHQDSGIRYSQGPSQIVDVPPTYTPE
ncbi:hypothetical protein V5O48_005364 [Marasmius crinis-equi]|uniref:Uncharacterized protein n=1 Tax=Marasmius crinis-equi TaxID=585013 RepID=A0ABR3FMV7_9AGAR